MPLNNPLRTTYFPLIATLLISLVTHAFLIKLTVDSVAHNTVKTPEPHKKEKLISIQPLPPPPKTIITEPSTAKIIPPRLPVLPERPPKKEKKKSKKRKKRTQKKRASSRPPLTTKAANFVVPSFELPELEVESIIADPPPFQPLGVGFTSIVDEVGTPATDQEILTKIENNKYYPTIAKRRKMKGSVLLSFQINSQGKAVHIEVLEPSHHKILNEAAIETLHRAEPLPAESSQHEYNIKWQIGLAYWWNPVQTHYEIQLSKPTTIPELNEAGRELLESILKNRQQTPHIRENHWTEVDFTGEAKFEYTLDNSGNPTGIKILKGSSETRLDQAAKAYMIRKIKKGQSKVYQVRIKFRMR